MATVVDTLWPRSSLPACSLKYNSHVLVLDLFANSPYTNSLFILHRPLIGNGLRGIKWSRDPCRHVTPKGTVSYPSDSLASWLLRTTDIFLWQNWRQHCHHVTKSTEFPRWVATSSAQILEKNACNNCIWNHSFKCEFRLIHHCGLFCANSTIKRSTIVRKAILI